MAKIVLVEITTVEFAELSEFNNVESETASVHWDTVLTEQNVELGDDDRELLIEGASELDAASEGSVSSFCRSSPIS